MRQRSRTSTRRWTRSCPWKSGLLEWCGSLANPHQRSGQPTKERTCRSATGVHTASRAERPTQLTGLQREQGEPPTVQIDYQFASEKVNMEVSAGQVVTAGPVVTIFLATCCGRGVVAATQCSKGAIAYLAAFLMGQLAAWGLGERTAVESHRSIGPVERMNRKVAGLLRTLKAALEARISSKVALDHDFISWRSRHDSAELISESVGPHSIRGHQAAQVRWSYWTRIPTTKKLGKLDQRWVEVVWAGKAEGSVWTIVERGDSEPYVASQKSAGGGAK